MSLFLTLDSVGLSSPNVGGDFTVNYDQPLSIRTQSPTGGYKSHPYELALVKTNCWYSWANISPTSNTNVIDYYNGAVWAGPLTIPTGQYSINDLNKWLHSVMKDNGDYTVLPSGVEQYDINITPNFNTLKVDITISGGYQLDLSLSAINGLLGWPSAIVSATGSGTNIANINNSINTLLVHCDIVTSSYQNNNTSNVICGFVPTSGPGTNINIEPLHLMYYPIYLSDQINRIRMYITDNLNRPVDFMTEPITYQLHLRPIDSGGIVDQK